MQYNGYITAYSMIMIFIVWMYAGQVLKHGKTLSQYNIVNGVTVFVMTKKGRVLYLYLYAFYMTAIEPVKVSVTAPFLNDGGTSQLRRLIHNPRIHQIVSGTYYYCTLWIILTTC